MYSSEKTKAIKHFIHTTKSSPVKQQPYHLPHAYWEEVKQEVEEMLAGREINPSQSDWACFCQEKDGSMHLCMDYRKLNAQDRTDDYPIPRTDNILD